MQQQKSLTHLPQSQNCQGIFPVLDARGLLLVKTKKVVPAWSCSSFLGSWGAYSPGKFWDFVSLKPHFLQFWGHFSANFHQYFGKYFIIILAFGVTFARYIRIYVGIYTAEIIHHITTSKEFNEKTKQLLITIYINACHYNNVNI